MPMQFLYDTGSAFVFMNMETYDQIEIDEKVLGNDKYYLTEGLEVSIIGYNGEILGVILPEKITVKIVETTAAVKGNTVNNTTKDAKIETGLNVKVPLFVEEGENIVVSTSDGKYVSRA